MKTIVDKTFEEERALYNLVDTSIIKCSFEGPMDGESALKECRSITVKDCFFDLRYPLWHAYTFKVINSEFSMKSRAPMWYCTHGEISLSKINGVKSIRECKDISIIDCEIHSTEFGWKNVGLNISNTYIESEYAFFGSKDIKIDKLILKGKYSFQYVKDVEIINSSFDTKDAFWHSKNVIVKDSIINGEYLGWYSDNLTLINCKISGTQPLCYCKNLKLIDCEMINTDLSFEYSDVNATIKGSIDSIKNPRSGVIHVDNVGEIISSDSIYKSNAKIIINKK